MGGRRANLILVPEGRGEIRQLRIRLLPAYALISLAMVLVLFLVGGFAAYFKLTQAQQRNAYLFRENEALRSELVALGERIDGLDSSVQTHIQLANETRLLAGLSPYSVEVAQLGVGGLPTRRVDGSNGMSGGVALTVGFYEDRLDQLSRQLSFQEESFIEVRDLIKANRERLDRIPAVNPVSGSYYVSSGFGSRTDPITGKGAFHDGLDMSAAAGTPFCATADGCVSFVGWDGGLGNTIRVDHENGYVTVYGHARVTRVRRGQRVKRGETLGEVGSSGRTTGVHLHYEVRQNGRPVNPRRFIVEMEG